MENDIKKIAESIIFRKYGCNALSISKIQSIENSNGVFFKFDFSIEDEHGKYCIGHIFNGKIFYGIKSCPPDWYFTE